MTKPPDASDDVKKSASLLLIVSDRPSVWIGFRALDRTVRRWHGGRETDEEAGDANTFTGDPVDQETYRWALDHADLSAVIDLQDFTRTQGAIDALRSVWPEAGVLVITSETGPNAAEIAVSRKLEWTDALRGDLEGELQKLETLRRLHALRNFAAGERDVAILVHPDPDPDALASALAVRALLRRDPQKTPIITLGEMTRPETRRMAELLRMRVTVVTYEELARLEIVVAVDHQPFFADPEQQPRLAVIDHHPDAKRQVAEFSDIRPDYGATATMMTEYLRLEDERRIGKPLATALIYGIKTDTELLGRGTIGADVQAYAFLQNHADLPLLRMLERPSYAVATARKYGAALAHVRSEDDVAFVFLGRVNEDDAHVMADIADFCLGLDEITWAIAVAIIGDDVVFTIRHLGGEEGAGELARDLARDGGNGGGHATMARAAVPLAGKWQELDGADPETGAAMLIREICEPMERLRASRRSSRRAHPGKAHSAKPQ